MRRNCVPKVAFIDDGISSDCVQDNVAFEYFAVDSRGAIANAVTTEFSHASKCYRIFCKHVQVSYNLISIQILLTETKTGSLNSLLAALLWCQEHNVDLINMSIGSKQYVDFPHIIDVIKKMPRAIIVAACGNSNTITFPACCQSVIGVRHSNIDIPKGEYIYSEMPYDQIECIVNTEENTNSMAVPVISARVCNYIANGCSDQVKIRQKLAHEAIQDPSFLSYSFYKSLLPNWENIQVPVISISDYESISSKTLIRIKSLINLFITEGYRAICITTSPERNIDDFVLNLSWSYGKIHTSDLIKLYYNFVIPDIIFLHINIKQSTSMPDELKPDLVVTKEMLKLDSKALFEEIKTHLL